MTLVCRLILILLSTFLTATALSAPAGLCRNTHESQLAILPTYSRVSPFDGTLYFQTPEGQIVPYNMLGNRTFFLTGLDELTPVQHAYDIAKFTVPELAANVYVDPRQVPKGSKLLPVDADALYENAVADIYAWTPEKREQERKRFLEEDQGRKQIARLSSTTLIPEFIKPVFPKIETVGDVVFVKLKVEYPESQIRSMEADLSRTFLDSYFTALQKVYREIGDTRLGKALKLLESWVHIHQGRQKIQAYMIYDKALWNLTMMQLGEALQNPELKAADSYSRTRYLFSYIRRFAPLGGMTVTSMGGRTYEVGRRFTNPETDPARIVFSSGSSEQGGDMKKLNQTFHRWILQDLPQGILLWGRAFDETNAQRLQKYGFIIPAQPTDMYRQSKEKMEQYWGIKRSWLFEQERDQWLQSLLKSGF